MNKDEKNFTTEAAASPQLTPEVAEKIAALRSTVRENFGKVVMSMMMLPRYKSQTLADLSHLVLEPMMRDRVAIAQKKDADLAQDITGLAIWASLSDEADARLREQISAGTWPVRLRAEDWISGNNHWLIDVIAPDQHAAASVIANFRQLVKEGSLRLHPIITKLVDPETLTKMGAAKISDHRTDGTDKDTADMPEINAPASAAVN